jgi:hypothetical protein
LARGKWGSIAAKIPWWGCTSLIGKELALLKYKNCLFSIKCMFIKNFYIPTNTEIGYVVFCISS